MIALDSVRFLVQQIEIEEKILATLKSKAASAPISRINGLPRAKAQTSRTEFFATMVFDSEQRLAELIKQKIEAEKSLTLEIAKISDCAQRDCLLRRYVDCLSFSALADKMGCSQSKAYDLHQRGRQEYERQQAAIAL